MIEFGCLIALGILLAASKNDRLKISIAIVATVLLMGGFAEFGSIVTGILGSL
ncbi:hypothetical protein [Streptomyces cyaneochromogenes]|uniref:hypothetical protein n=1 Tax=Streptomyces cyaneochromogenes TaxID=2496836 RepID=UPI00158B9E1A|nr:hypothetical protein [Streptomyces cyaneochromogenes]